MWSETVRTLTCVAIIASSALADEGEVRRLDISLENTRWQTLPREVERVYAGPDGRVWYQCQSYNRAPISAIKDRLAREFREESPQVWGAELVLFEPTGRVWFHVPAHLVLLGYDGKEWVEYVIADSKDRIRGVCLTRGGCTAGAANRYAGGAAWFVGSREIIRFDGKTWLRQRITEDAEHLFLVRLVVSPDGRTAAACQNGSRLVWVFQKGKWGTKPLELGDASCHVAYMAITDTSTLYALDGWGLQRLSLGGKVETEAGPKEIAGLPRSALFGSTRVSVPYRLFQDSAGRIYIIAKQIEDDKSRAGPGVLILDTANRARVILKENLGKIAPDVGNSETMPILTATGNEAWWPWASPEGQTRLLDLDRGEFVDAVPYPDRTWPQAIAGDGRLFVSVGGKAYSYFAPTRRMAYAPSAPETRVALHAAQIPLKSASFAIADDGAVWAVHRDQGLIRFDGRHWRPLVKQPEGYIRALCAGKGGLVAVWAGGRLSRTIFYRGDEQVDTRLDSGEFGLMTKQQREIRIKLRRETLQETFGPGSPAFEGRYRHNPGWQWAADRQGNIWSADESGNFLVESGDRQLSPSTEPLIKDGSLQVRISFLCPIGDGRKVYAADFDRSLAFLGEVKEGTLRFTPMPPFQGRAQNTMRDAEGCLWIPVSTGGHDGLGGRVTTPTIFRVGHEGIIERLETDGHPCLVDRAGNVWLGDVARGSRESIAIWRQGKLVQQIAVPGLDFDMLLVSDRAGSVYALTALGLQHLTADAPNFDHYRLANVYSIDEVIGKIAALEYSKLGCLVLTTLQPYSLYTVALPDPDNDADAIR